MAGKSVSLAVFLVAAPGLLASGRAWGQATVTDKSSAGAQAKKPSHATITNQGGVEHIVFQDAAVVTAQVQKPSVFFIIDHEQLGNYQWESLKQNFLPKILTAVQQEPF